MFFFKIISFFWECKGSFDNLELVMNWGWNYRIINVF